METSRIVNCGKPLLAVLQLIAGKRGEVIPVDGDPITIAGGVEDKA